MERCRTAIFLWLLNRRHLTSHSLHHHADLVLCVSATAVDKVITVESHERTDGPTWNSRLPQHRPVGVRALCQEHRQPSPAGPLPSGHGMVGLHPGTACAMPYGLPGNARGLIYSEFNYHQTALESDLLPQTPNGKKSSGHFRQQAMLALLAA